MAKKTWNSMATAPVEGVERWAVAQKDMLILKEGELVTLGYLERMASGRQRWRTINRQSINPDGWLPLPPP